MNKAKIKPWSIQLDGPVSEFSQTVFTIGNGYLGLRGFSLQEPKARPWEHALFRAGLYEMVKPGITDLVQLPDVLGLRVRGIHQGDIRHELNMQTGVYTQRWQDGGLQVECQRLASMADRQLMLVRLTVTALTEQSVSIQNVLDEDIANLPVHDDQMVEATDVVHLLTPIAKTDDTLEMETVCSHRKLRFCCKVIGPMEAHLQPGESLTVEKRVRLLLDGEAPNPECADPWAESALAWEKLWRDCDITLDAEDRIQGGVRYNLFQLLCSNASDDRRVSIGARGLTHGRYKGNTFWDTDIFLLPFYCWQRPTAARNLCLYRLDRLDDARALAKSQNLSGARFPWMCAADGREQCESWDIGLCEVHVTADVAYALERYQEISGDETLREGAAELYLETARYWQSRFTWEEGRQQYSSFFVKGPDEYCGAAVNNTYTNWMARHNVLLALESSPMSKEERKSLAHFAQHICRLYDPARDLYLQDELFDRLEPMPMAKRDGQPLYRSVCFDRMQRYRALKQADLVQLCTLLPGEITPAQQKNIWDTYEPLTVHDSSLSFGVHALLGFRLGLEEQAWDYFERSLFLDLEDTLHHDGGEGIHMASLGVSWQALVYGMLGLWSENGQMKADPKLPSAIRRMSLCVYHHGERYRITAEGNRASIQKEA